MVRIMRLRMKRLRGSSRRKRPRVIVIITRKIEPNIAVRLAVLKRLLISSLIFMIVI